MKSLCHFLLALIVMTWTRASLAGNPNNALDPSNVLDIGVLTKFYRATQLQGHLIGMGLSPVPDYLKDPAVAFPYIRNVSLKQEVPFVDTFTINRVLGGYPENWIRTAGRWDPTLGRRSMDYVTRTPSGELEFRPYLLLDRIQPYIAAGYTPGDITLVLSNVPWDVATPDGTPAKEGPWGRVSPPGDIEEWSRIVSHVAKDLKAYFGDTAKNFHFETGVEFDEKTSFSGDNTQFLAYFDATRRGLRSVYPDAELSPGEFTGLGRCPSGIGSCVYDSAQFLRTEREGHAQISMMPRSLHALSSQGTSSPADVAHRATESYSSLPGVLAEIHQFGLLYQPFGSETGGDPGPKETSWEFQTLLHLMRELRPTRVFHWGGLLNVGSHSFINGSGYLRLVLDHFIGHHLQLLPLRVDGPLERNRSDVAVVLSSPGAGALIVSDFSNTPDAKGVTLSFTIPPSLLGTRYRAMVVSPEQSVYNVVKHDLADTGNLKTAFAACTLCLGAPLDMAADTSAARAMVGARWERYRQQMVNSLRWGPIPTSMNISGNNVSVAVSANEFMVIEPF